MVATVKTASSIAPSVSSGNLALRAPQVDLARAVAALARIADRKSTMPILANVAIRVGLDDVTLCATDLGVSLTYTADHWIRAERGSFTVPAKQLADIVKSAPPGDTCLQRSAHGLRVEAGGVDTTLLGIPAQDFPKIPSPGEARFTEIVGPRFADLLDRVMFSVCQDETRFHLNGVYLETSPTSASELVSGHNLIAVSTDGHRLTLAQGDIGDVRLPKGVILPAKAAREIVKLIRGDKGAAVSIAVTGVLMFVRCGRWEIACKLIDAQFPPYWQVIPTDHKTLVTVAKKPLVAALKRVKSMCSDTRGVRIEARGDAITLTGDHPDMGTASETVPAEGCGRFTVGFNAKYLLDVLGEIDSERVTLAFGGELAPALIRATDYATQYAVQKTPYLGVVMPMRI